ncbi:hypothetical protein TIFTF001_026877 [Ficus carica]|uniref:Uncharacterized protein n=1 Tax=Ficus carica TaxID=3494 RepID=A0AA88IXK6_FICCA|nr:hypothetical protein TIFTF001_026877 [Ficus carica]
MPRDSIFTRMTPKEEIFHPRHKRNHWRSSWIIEHHLRLHQDHSDFISNHLNARLIQHTFSRDNNTVIGPNPTRSDLTVDVTLYSFVPTMGPLADITDVDNTATTATMTETNATPTDLMRGSGTSQQPANNFAACTRLQPVGAGQSQEAIDRGIVELKAKNEELRRAFMPYSPLHLMQSLYSMMMPQGTTFTVSSSIGVTVLGSTPSIPIISTEVSILALPTYSPSRHGTTIATLRSSFDCIQPTTSHLRCATLQSSFDQSIQPAASHLRCVLIYVALTLALQDFQLCLGKARHTDSQVNCISPESITTCHDSCSNYLYAFQSIMTLHTGSIPPISIAMSSDSTATLQLALTRSYGISMTTFNRLQH